MERYWDLSESDRAKLTREQVQSYLAVELMERGVLNPRKPELDPAGEAPAIVRRAMVSISTEGRYERSAIGVAFTSIDAAEAFLALGPLFVEHDYETGCEVAKSVDEASAQIGETIRVVPFIEHAAIKTQLAAHKSAKERNAAAMKAYADAMAKVRQETAAIWADWRACFEAELERHQVRVTFDEYVKMTKGDRELARSFLEKAYPSSKIREALGEVEPAPKPAPVRNGAAAEDGIPF